MRLGVLCPAGLTALGDDDDGRRRSGYLASRPPHPKDSSSMWGAITSRRIGLLSRPDVRTLAIAPTRTGANPPSSGAIAREATSLDAWPPATTTSRSTKTRASSTSTGKQPRPSRPSSTCSSHSTTS